MDERDPLLPGAAPHAPRSFLDRVSRPVLVASTALITLAVAVPLALILHPVYAPPSYPDAPVTLDAAALTNELDSQRSNWNSTGGVIAVTVRGEIVYQQAFGVKNEHGDPVTDDTLFQIGSSTKAFTALAAAIQVEEGKMTWDGPVMRYPVAKARKWGFYDEVADKEASLVDIMSHRTGLPRHDVAWMVCSDMDTLLTNIKHLPPNRQLRQEWQYNNHMFNLAGNLAGNASGLGWSRLVQSRILTPLGMNSTFTTAIAGARSSDMSTGFTRRAGEYKSRPIEKDAITAVDAVAPAGAIVSTAGDMAKWASFVSRGGKVRRNETDMRLVREDTWKRLVNPEMVMLNNLFPNNVSRLYSYGLGWFQEEYRGKVLVHHGGNTLGWSGMVMTVPEDEVGIVVLTNQQSDSWPMDAAYTIVDK
ncbi:hypothetical protein HK101_002939 [Irineochytrium annulatum]|nr:hypothetical protein HK101_002939 [Irineochytrium annulatum]